MLQTFLPLFVMTFGICLFIVLMQFLWLHIDDMVGKGLEIEIIAEMFFFAALGLVPLALPLSILLASLMTFGNLGERLELLAMKSAGISLLHIMRSLIVVISFVSVGAFFFQNYAMPVIQVKLYTLLYSMRQKSPELDIPEGSFYNGMTGFNVYVKSKDLETGLLKDLMIYDYSRGYNNVMLTLADSGRLKTSDNKQFLVLSLFDGESFQNLAEQKSNVVKKDAIPYRRETFATRELLIELDQNFNMYDEDLFGNNFMGKDLHHLQLYMDSIGVRLDSIKTENAREYVRLSYLKSFTEEYRNERSPMPSRKALKAKAAQKATPPPTAKKPKVEDKEVPVMDFDKLYRAETPGKKKALLTRARTSFDQSKSSYYFRAAKLGDESYRMRRHATEWHTKFTLSAACLLFFFIGAPMGAIIRKGGLGMPVVVSVIFFIFYYIVNNIGLKMARDGVWEVWIGMWISSVVLAPMGAFLTYKAANDSVLLNADTYFNSLKRFFGKKNDRKIERKEILIYTPDYDAVRQSLQSLTEELAEGLSKYRRWTNYISFWKEGGKDAKAEAVSEKMEKIVDELSNSDRILVLNKLMDFPFLGGYNILKMNKRITHRMGLWIGVFLPIGVPIYLFAVYQRKLLKTDLKQVQKTSIELIELIDG